LIRFLLLGGDENNSVHERGVQIFGAHIKGRLDLTSCSCLASLTIQNSIFSDEVMLQYCDIGALKFTGSLTKAIRANGAVFKGDVHFDQGFIAKSEILLIGAQIGGNLICSHASFEPKQKDALIADNAIVNGNIFFDEGFKSKGSVRLVGAQIGGSLLCNSGTFKHKKGIALSVDSAVIKGDIFFDEGFNAVGSVRLLGVQVGGDLSCSNASFESLDNFALSADGSIIEGAVFLDDGFNARGEVRLLGAQIGDTLSCSSASFENKQGPALSADRAVIKGSVHFDEGFKAKGEVRLLSAQIGGNLSCSSASFDFAEGDALNAEYSVIKGSVFLNDGFKANGVVDFIAAEFGSLVDVPDSYLKLELDGLRYSTIAGGAPTDAATRIKWLERQSSRHPKRDFRPQPWEQLIKVLREMGHYDDANQVAIAKQDALLVTGNIRQLHAAWYRFYRLVAGYGYRPQNIIAAMLLTWAICSEVFDFSKQSGWMAPSAPAIHTNALLLDRCKKDAEARQRDRGIYTKFNDAELSVLANCRVLPNEYTTFNPMIYSLDVLLPLVDLQQENDWSPMVSADDHWYSFRSWARYALWFEILFGWFCSLLLVAVLSNMVKKD